jgi:hypothetical protein
MSVIPILHLVVNTAPRRRPFGAGLVEPEACLFGTGDSPAWEQIVREMLQTLNYTPLAAVEIVTHLRDHGTAEGCVSLDPADLSLVNRGYSRARQEQSEAEFDAGVAGDVEGHPAAFAPAPR